MARAVVRSRTLQFADAKEFDKFRRNPSGFVDVGRLEVDIQRDVLDALRKHPRVAWAYRMNSGTAWMRITKSPQWPDGLRPVKFGFKGCSDIIGQLRGSGALLACECKRYGEGLRPEQQNFLEVVKQAGGVGFVARCVDDVYRELLQ